MSKASTGLFLPTTDIISTGSLNKEVTPEAFREAMFAIIRAFNESNSVINKKDSGLYVQEEFINGQLFFPDPTLSSTTSTAPQYRQAFRRTYKIAALLNAAPLQIPHLLGPTASYSVTRLYGTANELSINAGIPLPYVDVSGVLACGSIELRIDATNIYITPTGDARNFVTNYVVIEYLKQ